MRQIGDGSSSRERRGEAHTVFLKNLTVSVSSRTIVEKLLTWIGVTFKPAVIASPARKHRPGMPHTYYRAAPSTFDKAGYCKGTPNIVLLDSWAF